MSALDHKCWECGARFAHVRDFIEHSIDHIFEGGWEVGLDYIKPIPKPESSRVRGLRAMANQDASPHERDIARTKLKEMGLWP